MIESNGAAVQLSDSVVILTRTPEAPHHERNDPRGWCKTTAEQKPTPLEDIRFHLTDQDRLHLEQAEVYLQENGQREMMVDADLDTLDLHMPEAMGRWRTACSACTWAEWNTVGNSTWWATGPVMAA